MNINRIDKMDKVKVGKVVIYNVIYYYIRVRLGVPVTHPPYIYSLIFLVN